MLRTSRGCSFSRASEAPRRLVEADDAIPDASPRSIGQPLGPGCGILAGRNYRNDIAHGFLGQMDPVIATLLLRAGALFLIMPPRECDGSGDGGAQVAARSASPKTRFACSSQEGHFSRCSCVPPAVTMTHWRNEWLWRPTRHRRADRYGRTLAYPDKASTLLPRLENRGLFKAVDCARSTRCAGPGR